MNVSQAVTTVGDVLAHLGTPAGQIPLAVPYVFVAPPGSDPDAQGVHVIVKAIQRGLNKLGAKLAVDGILGADTAGMLDAVMPPAGSYAQRSWLQIMHAVIRARGYGKRLVTPVTSNGDAAMGDDGFGAALPMLAIGGVVVWLLMSGAKKRARA